MKALDYPVVIIPLSEEDGGGYLSLAPDLPGCMGDGETPDQALDDIRAAVREWIEAQQMRGVDIPSPGASAKRAGDRERLLLDAITSLVAYNEDAEEQIKVLERKLTELIAVLKEDGGQPRYSISMPERVQIGKLRKPH